MTKIERRRNRRKAASRRAIKAYWAQAYKEAYAQYLGSEAEYEALYADDELIALIAGTDHSNQYGLEVARAEACAEAERAFRRAGEALRRYICA